jgi:hypothetical protein
MPDLAGRKPEPGVVTGGAHCLINGLFDIDQLSISVAETSGQRRLAGPKLT